MRRFAFGAREDGPPPDWGRILLALLGIAAGILLIYFGLNSMTPSVGP